MLFSTYQKQSKETAIYPKIGHSVIYPALGLGDEAGEVLGKIKKIFRDKNGEFEENDLQEIAKELGDVLWYIAQIATELDIDLDQVASQNLEKLLSRKQRGALQGSGDNR